MGSILAIIVYGFIATLVTACLGDYQLLRGLGTILLYAIVIIPIFILLGCIVGA